MTTVKYKNIQYESKYIGPLKVNYYHNELNNIIYDLNGNSNFTYVNDNELTNPIYIIIDNNIELVYSFENNKLIIADNSARTNQQYVLSDGDRKILDILQRALRTLRDGLYNEKFTNYLIFNKKILKVIKNSNYDQFILYYTIHDKEYVTVNYKKYCYNDCSTITTMNKLYNALQLLYNIIIEKLNVDYNYNIKYDNEKLWGED